MSSLLAIPCAIAMLIGMALISSKTARDIARAILLAIFARQCSDWAICPDCQIFHNLRNGRMDWEPPFDWDGVRMTRLCQCCSNNLNSGCGDVAGEFPIPHNYSHQSGNRPNDGRTVKSLGASAKASPSAPVQSQQ